MNASELMQTYGAGDNSVTDRMWYELALKICKHISDEPLVDEVEYINEQIKAQLGRENDFTDDAERVFEKLNASGAAYTSRLSVECVRRELDAILKKEEIS
jgi:hypothetical protein